MTPKPGRPRGRVETSPRSAPRSIGIVGHVGNENLGDESIIAAVIQNLRDRWPDTDIVGFTLNPADTRQRHGIPSYPLRQVTAATRGPHSAGAAAGSAVRPGSGSAPQGSLRELVKRLPVVGPVSRAVVRCLRQVAVVASEFPFMLASWRHTAQLDLLVFAGSHQLNDFVGGPWAYPYTVLKWTLSARLGRAPVVFLSMGAGPIDSWLGRRFIRWALLLASYRSYRDETAKGVAESLQVSGHDRVVPDLAFSLTVPTPQVAPRRKPLVVGLNPLPLYADYWYLTDGARYEAYVAKLAQFADWLVGRGCEVRFIPTQLKVDPAVIQDIRREMTMIGAAEDEYDSHVVDPQVRNLDELIAALSGVDCMVATRYHGILLSLSLEKPVLAVAYHQKSRDLMTWLGLGQYVVSGDTFGVDDLIERFPQLEAEATAIAAVLRRKIPDFQKQVQVQYDEVFRLLEPTGSRPHRPDEQESERVGLAG